VAGNIVASSQIGSIEFAAERFGTPLVVVLGHSLCGAVTATLEPGQYVLICNVAGHYGLGMRTALKVE